MMSPDPALGILVVGHGSPRPEANSSFTELVARVSARLPAAAVEPSFFSLARPTIADQVARLAARGVKRLVVMPYFLCAGQHVGVDIPRLLDACRERHPDVQIEVLPTLQNDPTLEDVLVDRLSACVPREMPGEGPAIERSSHEIIERRLATSRHEGPERAVVRRVIHATARFSYAETLRLHPRAVARAVEALRAGRPVLCDVNMVKAGITHRPTDVLCAIDDPSVAGRRPPGTTRAAAAIEALAGHLERSIVAIGNAPTALWKVLEIAAGGGPRPALVVGLPVGLVGAREAKRALLESDLCFITNVGSEGGSAAAAAAVNALVRLAAGGEGDDA